MRKTSYFLTFLAVIGTLSLNILSIHYPDWLYVQTSSIFGVKISARYGLLQRCERDVINIPGPGEGGRIDYTQYSCRPFPQRKADLCESDNRDFCTLWWTAGYAAELSVAFGVAAALGLVIGVSTRSKRRRVWRAVAVLVALHASFQIVAFGIVTDIYRQSRYPTFEYARPSTSYILNTLSWVGDVFIIIGVVATGLAADAGHKWAAGNRSYRPVDG